MSRHFPKLDPVLAAACEAALLDTLPQSLKDTLDAALSRGVSVRDCKRMVRRACLANGARRNSLTELAAQAYLDSRK